MNQGLLRNLCLKQSFLWHSVIALLDSSFRWNDDEAIDADWQPCSLNPCLLVIPAQAGIQWLIQYIPASAGMPVF